MLGPSQDLKSSVSLGLSSVEYDHLESEAIPSTVRFTVPLSWRFFQPPRFVANVGAYRCSTCLKMTSLIPCILLDLLLFCQQVTSDTDL